MSSVVISREILGDVFNFKYAWHVTEQHFRSDCHYEYSRITVVSPEFQAHLIDCESLVVNCLIASNDVVKNEIFALIVPSLFGNHQTPLLKAVATPAIFYSHSQIDILIPQLFYSRGRRRLHM